MGMHTIKNPILIKELKEITEERFGDLVKAVIDVRQEMMVVGGELHADEEVFLTDKYDSKREDLWGINLYPDMFPGDDFVEFDSMINIKPTSGNRSRNVEDKNVQEKIKTIVTKLVRE